MVTEQTVVILGLIGLYFWSKRNEIPEPPAPQPSQATPDIAPQERGIRSFLPWVGRGAPVSYLPPNHYCGMDPVGILAVLRLHHTGERLGAIRFRETIFWKPHPESQSVERGVAFWVTHSTMDAITGRVHRYPSDPRNYYHPAYITPRRMDMNLFLGQSPNSTLEVSIECHDAQGLPLDDVIELPVDSVSVKLLYDDVYRMTEENDALRMKLHGATTDYEEMELDTYSRIKEEAKAIRETHDALGLPAEKDIYRGGYAAYPKRKALTPQDEEIAAKLERTERAEQLAEGTEEAKGE